MMLPEEMSLRTEFPLTERMIYLDVAYHNILPTSSAHAMATFCREQLQGGGDPHLWEKEAELTRAKLARLIGAGPEEIAFVKNTAEGLSIAASALPLRPDDNVVINDLEHPSNVYPWRNLERLGIQVRVVNNVGGRLPVPELLAATDARTRAIAISAVQFSNGLRTDLAGLAEHCRPRRVYLVVDAIQALGVLDFDVRRLGVDVVAGGGHKGLLAPYGIGGLYVRRELIPELHPAHLGGEGVYREGVAEELRIRDDACRFEVGNYNFPGLAGLSAGVDILLGVGVKAIEQHLLELCGRLTEGLRRLDLTVVSPLGHGERSSIVVFALPDPDQAVRHFEASGARVSLRRGNIRVSTHLYNTTGDIHRFLGLVESYLASR